MFGDSSQDTFSTAAFPRTKTCRNESDSKTELAFAFGKARVAPMKPFTITILEQQTALLAARLPQEITKALTMRIERVFRWTNTSTVLQWVNLIQKQPVIVANRVAEILDLTTVDNWHNVQTSDDPAFAGTRGLSTTALLKSNWLKNETTKSFVIPNKASHFLGSRHLCVRLLLGHVHKKR